MFYKFFLSSLIVLFVAACATKPKDAADSAGSGSSGSDDGSVEGTITETTVVLYKVHEDLIVNVGDRCFWIRWF